jgi:REP element-mobilizing transposase RayT
MPSYRGPRLRINPETFAVTIVTHQRHRIFQRTTTAKLMIDTLFRYRDQSRFALHAFVVVPDHLHAMLTPSSDQTIERCVQRTKGGFSSPSATTSRATSGKTDTMPTASLMQATIKISFDTSPTTQPEKTTPTTPTFTLRTKTVSTPFPRI